MSPIVRARLQMLALPVMPYLPEWLQTKVFWWLAPPGFREQSEANLREALAHRFAETFKPDPKPEAEVGTTGPRPSY
jgi:hypothetical protein